MSFDGFFQVLIAFGAFQAVFMAVVLSVQPKHGWPKRFFAAFLLIEGITLIERLLAETGLIEHVPHLIGVSVPISFLKLPMLFLTVLALVHRNFRLKKVHAWHAIPFALMLVLNVPLYMGSAEAKLALVQEFLTREITYSSAEFYISLSFFVYSGVYVWATMRQLQRFRTHVRGNALVNFFWKVMVLFSVFLGAHFAYFVLEPSGLIDLPSFNMLSMLVMTFLVQSVAYSFLTGAHLFEAKGNVDLDKIERFMKDEKRLLQKLAGEKLFLRDTLTITEVADELGLSKKYVSELINHRFDCSFKDLINGYRVDEAKTIMSQLAASKISLIEVAYDSGFNNKVSFYRTFKRHTGQAPSDYFKAIKQGA